MNEYRPYVDAATFKYPLDHGGRAQPLLESGGSGLEYLHIDELVSAHSQVAAVGSSMLKFYLRMAFSQPFEVSRFLTQVGDWRNTPRAPSVALLASGAGPVVDEPEPTAQQDREEDEEDIDYFVDVSGKPQEPRNAVQLYKPAANPAPQAIDMSNGPYILSTASALVRKEGFPGLWRGMNASCLCRAATGVVGAWITSFLASACGVPDPQFVDVLHTLDPLKVAAVSIAGCAATAYLLSPLFIIRARLIATSMSHPDKPRSLRWSLMDMMRRGKFVAPFSVALPSVLTAAMKNAIVTMSPLLCWRYAEIDVFNTPRMFHFAQLGAELVFLLFKLPLETLAARAEVQDPENQIPLENAIVRLYPYKGILHTVWEVLSRKQSMASLYRGWRSELVGVIGEWGYEALEEKRPGQERF